MSMLVHAPPYMLGERPTPLHGGSGAPTFRQVPFVRVNERVESGVKVRKQLRKYLKASSSTQHMVAQMHLSDACITVMQPQEVAQSCFESFFLQMKVYNELVGQKHLEASKAFLEMTRPLENSGKSRKWARDVYNFVQKCVQDVTMAERKMDKARVRKEAAEKELSHWKKVLEANEATYQVQPNNPEVIRAYQLAQYRFSTAFAEDEAATAEYDDSRSNLLTCIERRDQVVEEATELSQSMEEDRLDTMLIVIKQFVETKVAILQAEIEAMSGMQRIMREMDRESVIQQYIVDSMQSDLTHRHAKALHLLEWHRAWHHEQTLAAVNEPTNVLALSPEDAAKVKSAGISANDVDVIKDFIGSCFVNPEELLCTPNNASSRHRNRFTDTAALAMYRMEIVRKIIVNCLNHQRAHHLELSNEGFTMLVSALQLLLDACEEQDDAWTAKSLMNMMQTFYRTAATSDGTNKEFLYTVLASHSLWSVPQYWGNALLLTIAEELSKSPQEVPWYFLSSHDRTQMVLHVHNMVFGQLSSLLLNLATFGFSRKQVRQFVQQACFSYELPEHQRISLLASVESLPVDSRRERRRNSAGEDVIFTSSLPDWTTLTGAPEGGPKLRSFRHRTQSTVSDTRSVDSNVSGTTVTSLADMKNIASANLSASVVVASSDDEESWEDLFGANGEAGVAEGEDHDDKEKTKRKKKRQNSRRFNDQLRLARSVPLSKRINGEDANSDRDSEGQTRKPSKQANGTSDKDKHAEPHAFFPSHHPVKAVDDSSLLTSEQMEKRRRSRRMTKTRSANVIDTHAIDYSSTEESQYFPVAKPQKQQQPPQQQQQQQPPANPPPVYTQPTTVIPNNRAASMPARTVVQEPSDGLDQIKTIAAKMKQRRDAASANMDQGGRSNALNGSASASLRRSQSSATIKSSEAAGEDTYSRPALARSVSSSIGDGVAASASSPTQATGVAALRARFERL
ncbi:TPA: hypothetical protein N0F65_012642 [Lagenidium giganteum]|uniref:SBF1/SBF2 domain-containing protein n=1 Tax=Lagenidium giganteum TaxID=4803 RepID=A0AAV2YIT4_9STRA|nr:TPA: hypothetical protein N0F65_012642 [Lagenidium giganteum]